MKARNWRKTDSDFLGDWYRNGELKACVAREDGLWHLSISHRTRYPSWNEIFDAWHGLVPDAGNIEGTMILPRKAEYVNIHANCFHVWQTAESAEPVIK